MTIGRYTCNVRGCIEAIEEINLRKKYGYKEALIRQISRGKLLLSLYEQIIAQRSNGTISMKWFYILRDDIVILKSILNTHHKLLIQ